MKDKVKLLFQRSLMLYVYIILCACSSNKQHMPTNPEAYTDAYIKDVLASKDELKRINSIYYMQSMIIYEVRDALRNQEIRRTPNYTKYEKKLIRLTQEALNYSYAKRNRKFYDAKSRQINEDDILKNVELLLRIYFSQAKNHVGKFAVYAGDIARSLTAYSYMLENKQLYPNQEQMVSYSQLYANNKATVVYLQKAKQEIEKEKLREAQAKKEELKSRAEEKTAYNHAISSHSYNVLYDYINTYPNSEGEREIVNRLRNFHAVKLNKAKLLTWGSIGHKLLENTVAQKHSLLEEKSYFRRDDSGYAQTLGVTNGFLVLHDYVKFLSANAGVLPVNFTIVNFHNHLLKFELTNKDSLVYEEGLYLYIPVGSKIFIAPTNKYNGIRIFGVSFKKATINVTSKGLLIGAGSILYANTE